MNLRMAPHAVLAAVAWRWRADRQRLSREIRRLEAMVDVEEPPAAEPEIIYDRRSAAFKRELNVPGDTNYGFGEPPPWHHIRSGGPVEGIEYD